MFQPRVDSGVRGVRTTPIDRVHLSLESIVAFERHLREEAGDAVSCAAPYDVWWTPAIPLRSVL